MACRFCNRIRRALGMKYEAPLTIRADDPDRLKEQNVNNRWIEEGVEAALLARSNGLTSDNTLLSEVTSHS